MDVRLSVRPGHACTVVEVTGDLDMATSPQLHAALRRLHNDDAMSNVVVDLRGVGFMDSSALGVLVEMFKTLRDSGGRLCLAAVQKPVRNILAITSVDRAIDVYDTVQVAEASMPPDAE